MQVNGLINDSDIVNNFALFLGKPAVSILREEVMN